jgi:hypothetical protein
MTTTVRNLVGRLALVLAVAGAGFGPARAAADPTDATNAAGATDPTEASKPADAAEADGAPSAADASDAAAQLPQSPVRRRSASPLDRRVALLAKELGLSATQQAQVRKALESQREQVARVWNDESIPAARRVSATQAISDRTADQIRALLTDEQRKKYIKPRQREAAVGVGRPEVQDWMNAANRK